MARAQGREPAPRGSQWVRLRRNQCAYSDRRMVWPGGAVRSRRKGRGGVVRKKVRRSLLWEWLPGSVRSMGLCRSGSDVLFGVPEAPAAPPCLWWGVNETTWFRARAASDRLFGGLYIDDLEFRVDQFRIPPRELEEMLPQQTLMLDIAVKAARDARWDERIALSTGVFIGIGLDLSTTNYHLRWSLAGKAARWNETLGLELSREELEAWIDDLKNAAGPALSANRTIGSLGGMVASRVARELRIGGPSFTVSCDETSGIQALEIAAGWLKRRELDAAIVGAVDFDGDLRAVLARQDLESRPLAPCDGAVALVLKRLDDARRDGDRVYALLCDSDGEWGQRDRPRDGTPIEYVDLQSAAPVARGDQRGFRGLRLSRTSFGSEDSLAVGSIEGDIGSAGAASGLAAVTKAALCLSAADHSGPGREPRLAGFWGCDSGLDIPARGSAVLDAKPGRWPAPGRRCRLEPWRQRKARHPRGIGRGPQRGWRRAPSGSLCDRSRRPGGPG